MALFDDVFNKACVYDMLFFNVKSVLTYPSLDALKAGDELLYDRWCELQKTKYYHNLSDDDIYLKYAPLHAEFSRIAAITYATVHPENGTIKRSLRRIVDVDEYIMIAQFIDLLDVLSSNGNSSEPKFFPILCGYNIIGNDIPLLIKRYLHHRNKLDNKRLPLILKNALTLKPWESGVLDVANVWKFNGNGDNSLMLISDFMGLKKTVNILPLDELSKYYWDNIEIKTNEALEHVSLQSATQVNLVIQLVNELRQF